MKINQLIKEAHENAVKHGFWEDHKDYMNGDKLITLDFDLNVATQRERFAIGNILMLIVSELGEAQEGLRHNDVENFKEELADVAIRLADLCGGLGIDLEEEILKKMEKNKNRPYKHGKEF